MKNKFTSFYTLLFCLAVAYIGTGLSSGPSALATGAPFPGEGSCANAGCHGGSSNVDATIRLVGAPTDYTSGETYQFSIRMASENNPFAAGGFQLVATEGASNEMVGAFNPVPGSGTRVLTNSPEHRRLVQSERAIPTTNGANGSLVEWDVEWTAPANGAGTVTFFYAGNASNFDYGTSGDKIVFGDLSVALPVEWNAFEATARDGAVLLNWQTATERYSDYFGVERSTDGRTYTEIGRVAARGDSDTATDYAFTDRALPTGTTLYYRLRQVDLDGTASYSDTRSVAAPVVAAWSFGPNPAGRGTALTLHGTPPQEALVLYSSTGQVVQRFGAGTRTLALRNELQPGIYWLQGAGGGTGRRLLIQ